jgi:hypothetical protein
MRPNDVPYSKRLDRVLLESPHIAEYIRELQVYESQEFEDQNWIGTDHTLPRLLPKLTNLTRIKFQRLKWDDVPSDLRRSIYSVLELPSLTYVELEKATFFDIDDLKDLRSLLCHAKYSTSLSLNGIIVLPYEFSKHKGEDEDPEAEAEEQGLHLRLSNLVSLSLSMDRQAAIVDWLIGPRSPWDVSHLPTLQILDSYLSDTDATNRLLQAIGSSLWHFHFLVPWNLSSEYLRPILLNVNPFSDFS